MIWSSYLFAVIYNRPMWNESGFGLAGGTGRKLYVASIVARNLGLLRGNRVHFRSRGRSLNVGETMSAAIN